MSPHRSRYWQLKEAGELDPRCNFGSECLAAAEVYCPDGRGGGAHPMGWCLNHEPGCKTKHQHIPRAEAGVTRMSEPGARL